MESRRGLLKKTLGGAVLLAAAGAVPGAMRKDQAPIGPHAIENLYVIESVFPTSLGVNPMESIYGIASRASGHVLKALS